MAIKFGVTTWVWTSPLSNGEIKRLIPHVANLGFDLIELPLEGLNDFDVHLASQLLRANNLTPVACAAMAPDRDLIHPDSAVRENGMAYIRHCIDAAQAFGATNLIGPIYSATGRCWQMSDDERRRATDLLVNQLSLLARYAEERGVVLCIEPLNRFETSFLNLVSQANEVIDRVDSPSCKLLLDTFHMNIEEKSIGDAIRSAGARIAHFHACENDRGTPGSGHLPWGDVAQALKDVNYDGTVVIETFTDKVKSIARAAAIWRPLAADPDKLARDGLQFLKQLFQQHKQERTNER